MVPVWLKLALHSANLRILIVNNIRNEMERSGHRQIETVLQHNLEGWRKCLKPTMSQTRSSSKRSNATFSNNYTGNTVLRAMSHSSYMYY